MRFIVDCNVGKLARWLRIAGFDTLFFKSIDDNRLVRIALAEDRVLLTRDTHIPERRVAVSGRLKLVIIEEEDVKAQLRQVVSALDLASHVKPFTLCVECNETLESREKDEVRDLVPPYVFKTQEQYVQCPACQRVYWKGTHWDRMSSELAEIVGAA
jgi:uncharacterized protein with PIN domain